MDVLRALAQMIADLETQAAALSATTLQIQVQTEGADDAVQADGSDGEEWPVRSL